MGGGLKEWLAQDTDWTRRWWADSGAWQQCLAALSPLSWRPRCSSTAAAVRHAALWPGCARAGQWCCHFVRSHLCQPLSRCRQPSGSLLPPHSTERVGVGGTLTSNVCTRRRLPHLRAHHHTVHTFLGVGLLILPVRRLVRVAVSVLVEQLALSATAAIVSLVRGQHLDFLERLL